MTIATVGWSHFVAPGRLVLRSMDGTVIDEVEGELRMEVTGTPTRPNAQIGVVPPEGTMLVATGTAMARLEHWVDDQMVACAPYERVDRGTTVMTERLNIDGATSAGYACARCRCYGHYCGHDERR